MYFFAGEKTEIVYAGKIPRFKGANNHFYQYLADFKLIVDSLYALREQRITSGRRIPEEENAAFREEARLPVRRYESRVKADNDLTPKHKEVLVFGAQNFSKSFDGSLGVVTDDATYEHWRRNGNEANGYAPDFFKTTPVASQGVFDGYFYFDLVNSELLQNLWRPIEFHLDESGADYDDGTIGLRCAEVITRSGFPEPFSELLLAKNLYHCLRQTAVTPSVAELYDQFTKHFPRSAFAPALKRQFAESKSLSSGEPAKEIYGFREDGRRFRLSELKGKVVYVDFWATWCGPCIEQFPHSRKLIQQFTNDDGIVFLFVSFDRDARKWKEFLRSKKMKGIHVIADRNSPSVADAYRVTAIPHYLLIDHLGNIKSAYAMSPSQPETGATITGMLAARRAGAHLPAANSSAF
ncbi:TlpA family protein disulfide reductase [Dyadobacter fermentans]|uniref:TlpA family protein disulfide reductase n=1 Tax=Dyadobacter fermentans TaxID=94254 RepID=UPI001CC09665|nr:TlpA disulfide reductase family protein [Dyadobacter fermentans]MBZ1358000.1 TlpA family protein disulfide reductase [Dyadobacter fermentans]